MYAPPKKVGPRRAPIKNTAKMHLRVGDLVRILSGKDRGKEGKITRLLPRDAKVVIEGINIIIKHEKPRQTAAGTSQGGGRIEQAAPLRACKVQLIDPANSSRVTRVGYRLNDDGSRTRIARKSGGVIDNA